MSIVDDLFEKGYSIQPLSITEAFQIAAIKLEALKFFNMSQQAKESELYKGHHLGYRPIGGEYVGSPDFWDVNESISYSRMSLHLVRKDSVAKGFYEASEQLYAFYDGVVQAILAELKSYYRSNQIVPETKNSSWIQINYYQQLVAKSVNRNLMQGKHEDGHLVTIWSSQDDGMEFFPDGENGEPTPVKLNYDHVLVMPGDLLTKITGGDIKPMFHQVKCIDSVYTRLAVMYFANPDPSKKFYPYASHADQINISAIVESEKLLIRSGNPTVNNSHLQANSEDTINCYVPKTN